MEDLSHEITSLESHPVDKASFISLALDDYEDLFSDFDPRPYSERSLSEDFLHELKRAAMSKEEKGLSLLLLIPKERHNAAHEHTILERLKNHFRHHHRLLEEQRKKVTKTGARMVALGVAFMFLATYLLVEIKQNLWTAFIVVLLEPAGWFTFWEGLNFIVFRAKDVAPELSFYRKMSGAKVSFMVMAPT
ncbi:MAG TPA: hypothetical protein VJ873_13980, partial [bacterium]|nr:hypothetical protein [bacterium]